MSQNQRQCHLISSLLAKHPLFQAGKAQDTATAPTASIQAELSCPWPEQGLSPSSEGAHSPERKETQVGLGKGLVINQVSELVEECPNQPP